MASYLLRSGAIPFARHSVGFEFAQTTDIKLNELGITTETNQNGIIAVS